MLGFNSIDRMPMVGGIPAPNPSSRPFLAATKVTLLLAIMSLLLVSGVNAAPGRMVVIIAGNTSIRDIADPALPHLSDLIKNGSAALMNVRTGRPSKLVEPVAKPGMEPGCVSLGAGMMASGGAEVRRAGNASGRPDDAGVAGIYSLRTGRPAGRAQVLHTEIARITRVNATGAYRAQAGALGSALRRAGIKTAVIGNSDLPGDIHREAVAFAMDESGVVDFGSVGPDVIQVDPHAPYGLRSNPQVMLRELDKALASARFVVLDFGDTFRADSYAELCTDSQALRARSQAAARLDAFVDQVTRRLDFSTDSLVLLSPSSRIYSEIDEERLASVVIEGPGAGGGMLVSPSTRRNGIVTVGDVAPTVLAFFDIKPPSAMAGRPMISRPRSDVADALLKLNMDATLQAQRQPVMRGASVAQSVVVVLAGALILLGAPGIWRKSAAWLALIPIAIPLAMLCMPPIYSGGLVGAVVLLVGLTLGIVALFGLLFRSPMRALAWMCAATVLALGIDLLLGGRLNASSIASYGLVEGARYYGIGNELMGTLLGAALIGAGLVFSHWTGARWKIPAAVALSAIVFALIGAPSLGANAGGAAAAAPAMVVMVLAMMGWRPSARGLAMVVLVCVAVVVGLFALDAVRGGASQSHIGRAVETASGGNGLGLLHIAQRKIALNFMLLSTSVWSRLLGLSLIGAALAYWRGRREFGAKFLVRDESAAAWGGCVAVVAAFAFNDSGVLAAATCSVFLWALITLGLAAARTK